ncbi:hypothetical protein [[Enterobacter] lignolyticus]|uniref:Uncharacterized protein n=1 Tax=Enterobacter lignolyticus (strain SCF1) TaxID=701347 RepID=E3G8W8_ENTLS|nr:hypothetical protein [[Enterobacter] lignolyticus]ADO48689.1 hypothetical protein Entcl_2438 [[Enterobacter] lignolyticus SCF1]
MTTLSTEFESLRTSTHDNLVTLSCANITNIQYIPDSFDITSGQPHQNSPIITRSGNTWSIHWNCGRKGSGEVASRYATASSSLPHMYGLGASDNAPEQLNFYFGLAVSFTIYGKVFLANLYLGQGHTGSSNNWWIGGLPVNGNTDTVTISDGAGMGKGYQISSDSLVNDFTLS